MRTAAVIFRWIVRITGVIQIVLGVLFWTGNADALVPVHMLSGLILVISLWVLGILALQSHTNVSLAIVAFIWGLITIALGMTQGAILPGSAHWVIQVIHLLVGIGAIGMADRLANGILHEQMTTVRTA